MIKGFTRIHLNQVNIGTNLVVGHTSYRPWCILTRVSTGATVNMCTKHNKQCSKEKFWCQEQKNAWRKWHFCYTWKVYLNTPRFICFRHPNPLVQIVWKFQLHDIHQQKHQMIIQVDYFQWVATGLGYQFAANANRFTSNHWGSVNLSEHTTTASTYHNARWHQHTR